MEVDTADELLTSLEWTDDEEVALSEAVISDGKPLIPTGINKHFYMIILLKKFQIATKKRVHSKVLWDRLNEDYDLSTLDKVTSCPFPNEVSDFSLPDHDFGQLMRDRKGQSMSSDKLDEDSRDSGSGRETPPTLPLAKRGGSLQSGSGSTKRKFSSMSSDTGSDGGSGRKSSGTPFSGGSNKIKRRI